MIKSGIVKSVLLSAALSLGLAGAMAGAVQAADYPEKPITLVIPLGAGGSHDLNARVFTSVIPQYINQAMIVQLSPGASGQKGTNEVATADADGYKLLFTHNYIDQLQQHVENLPYDPLADFVTVARINFAPIAIVVKGDSPYKSAEELFAAAKENPGKVRMAHSGNWGALFVPAAQLMQANEIDLNLVPYKGGGPAMQALLSGDADMTMGFPSTLSALLDSGEVRVLATAGDKRIYPDVPSFSELGVGGDVGFMHRVVLAPKGIPQDRLDVLRAAFLKLNEDKTYQRLMSRLGENIDYMSGDDYEKLRADQAEAYKSLVAKITGG
ncbi:MAG: tripartite tricarboxylate transporter substrate binding protein [Rhizobiaceae bacterium]|nr:tripartite tricarboxylate transporter substrate binding protein [Rhizobiaceae bacterium]|tara:strand:- start:37219 stop:38196 length:978 start_codon:yes stop_codon:yes gene_type:complete